MTDSGRGAQETALVIVVALVAVGLVLSIIGLGGEEPGRTPDARPQAVGAMLLAVPPEIPPAVFADEAPELARASNAAVPLVPGTPPAASPFHFTGSAEDRAAALACLSVAVLYEAGDDAPGERAVAQVVLNRLRHPAFPKTVCGVILQGSERSTGCQFTFTCDGALARAVPPAMLERARAIADAALSGTVDKTVGTATHYHTDWVVPYWRSSLAKIAIVHTQIFYRWPGAWGSRAALTGRVVPGERPNARMASLMNFTPAATTPMAAEQAGLPIPKALEVAGLSQAALNGNIIRLKDEDAGQFVLQLNPTAPPGSYAIAGFNLCGEKLECTVFGWTSASEVPRTLPILPWMMQSLAFVYRKSNTLGIAQGYWDCKRFPRPLPAQCLTN
jgi:spore germination cell wall hydrolase CwlJ-like protein